jgi:hypothetical protein
MQRGQAGASGIARSALEALPEASLASQMHGAQRGSSRRSIRLQHDFFRDNRPV